MFDWVGDKLKGLLEDTINSWVEEFMNWILSMMNKIVFDLPESNFVDDTMSFFAWFTGIFAVIIALYKIVEYIINTQNGTQQYPLDEIILRLFKSAGAMLVLPWFIKILFMQIALPMANYFAAAGTDFDGKAGYTVVSAVLAGSVLGVSGFVLSVVLIFFLIVFVMFLYSVCVFYADYVIMQILIAPVALSMLADDNNYFQVWWRELLSIVVSLLIKLFLVTLIINILFTGGNILLAVGAGALIIKSPSVLKNMWYSSGSSQAGGRSLGRGAGSIGSMGSRMLLTKLLK